MYPDTGSATVRLRITPRDTSFFDLFADLAKHLVTGADLLADVIEAEAKERKKIVGKLSGVENAADEATHSIMRRLNQTFVTPFDRDDIYELASNLDDCMDYMEEAGELILLYKIDRLPEGCMDQVETLQRAAELTAEAMPRLKSLEDLKEYWIEINRLENVADKAHRNLLVQLFENGTDAIEIMKFKDIIETLEAAADAFETVANTVETITVKES